MLKEFSTKNSSKAILIGGAFAAIGIAFMFLSFYVGLIIVLAAIGLFLYLQRNRSYTNIICKDDGFTVITVNKNAVPTKREFTWSDVKEIRIYEREFVEEHHTTAFYFQVKTKKGISVNLPITKSLDELIDIFNEKATHLPYTWIKQKGMFSPYQKQDRE